MELYVNGNKIDITLENEKTVGDVLRSFETECSKNKATTVAINLDGQNVSAEEFEAAAIKPLTESTKIELSVISEDDVTRSFKQEAQECRAMADKLEQIPSLLQAGNDTSANTTITSLANLIDSFCHTASLSALFPQKYQALTINGSTLSQFFADFTPILSDFEHALEAKDSVLVGDLAEYEISPRLRSLAEAVEV